MNVKSHVAKRQTSFLLTYRFFFLEKVQQSKHDYVIWSICNEMTQFSCFLVLRLRLKHVDNKLACK